MRIAAALVLAAIPALVFRENLRAYQRPPVPSAGGSLPRVSVLIPARNEERSIQEALFSVTVSFSHPVTARGLNCCQWLDEVG